LRDRISKGSSKATRDLGFVQHRDPDSCDKATSATRRKSIPSHPVPVASACELLGRFLPAETDEKYHTGFISPDHPLLPGALGRMKQLNAIDRFRVFCAKIDDC
jgi:hypothetical protein